MELWEAIFNRHSIRTFKKEGVEEEKFLRVLETGNQAPSAGNLQARDFIVVRDERTKKDISKAVP